ncbi:MAG: lipopolysaccharide biosynthesis protein RfbH [Pelagibacteraceae bacterium]|nr:lipopolysaccharide biosynthesis protein RfbH [Pelagibacteraceae bacterium]
MTSNEIRAKIAKLVKQFADETLDTKTFVADDSTIPPSGKVIGANELQFMVDASLDGWLTTGRFNKAFEERLASYLGTRYVLTTNSGSSANLLALTALTSPKLGDKALLPGDEVITVAASFPTTVNPIIQNNLIPVFIDVDLATYNIQVDKIESAISSKTKAIMIAHTLGNPYNLSEVKRIAEKYNLWLIEDCCDALGTTYNDQMVGTFGDIATLSFYPAHHITTGEGGAVFTQSPKLNKLIESFRDWGRDCFCNPGVDNTCGKRFDWQLGSLPKGYDHKYIYSHLGYNLKMTDMQAACGLAQMDRIEGFIDKRKKNFNYLKNGLQPFSDLIILPEATKNSDPSWFGFPITIKPESRINRIDLLRFLDNHKIGTRLLFSGNIIRQPYFKNLNYRIFGELTNTDVIMNHSFWLGVYPGINEKMLDFIIAKISVFLSKKRQ